MGLVVACSGQGSQRVDMFERFAQRADVASIFDAATIELGFDPRNLTDDTPIHLNRIAQPLLCTYNLVVWRLLAPLLANNPPMLFLGYSIGEIGAHVISGRISSQSALQLCADRARSMDAAVSSPQGMVAVRGLPRADIEELCAKHALEVAIVNGPFHFVLGGTSEAIDGFCDESALERASNVRRLAVTVAAHTRLLSPATDTFAAILEDTDVGVGDAPVLAGISASPVSQASEVRRTLALQLSTPIQWENCLITAREMGASCMLELGPGCALSRIARELIPDMPARSVSEFRGLEGVVAWVARNAG